MEQEQERKEEQQAPDFVGVIPVELGKVWGVRVESVLHSMDWFFTTVPYQMLIDLHEKILAATPQAKKDGNYLPLFNQAKNRSPLREKLTPEQIKLVDARLIWSFLFAGGDFDAIRGTFKAVGIEPKEAFIDREPVENKEEESLSA